MDKSLIDDDLRPICIRLATRDIAYVKFIIESYDGLAIVRTLDPEQAEIVVLALADTVVTVREILAWLSREVQLEEVLLPPDISSDWLLAPTD